MSHIKHCWYDAHETVHHQRMDNIGKKTMLDVMEKNKAVRPQTASSAMSKAKKTGLLPDK